MCPRETPSVWYEIHRFKRTLHFANFLFSVLLKFFLALVCDKQFPQGAPAFNPIVMFSKYAHPKKSYKKLFSHVVLFLKKILCVKYSPSLPPPRPPPPGRGRPPPQQQQTEKFGLISSSSCFSLVFFGERNCRPLPPPPPPPPPSRPLSWNLWGVFFFVPIYGMSRINLKNKKKSF